MKKCIVVSDSFKGSLSSLDICSIAQASIPKFFPDCQIIALPVADGGEGTVDCFIQALSGQRVTIPVAGPYGKPVQASYCRDGTRAVIEMSAAAGLPLAAEHLNPEETTTYGVGQLINHAVENGCTDLLLGLGGSCTNDGGCGCAAALGVRFQKEDGTLFVPTGKDLEQIWNIDPSQARRQLKGVHITVMCDVDNPLHGPDGAAFIFGPQKGADIDMVRRLDSQLSKLDKIIAKELGRSVANIPGAGAAGGMGAGCIAFLDARLKPGIEAVLDMVGFDGLLPGTDLVITGEGRIDVQSIHGKVISGLARRTKLKHIPLIAIVGGIASGSEAAYDLGVTAMFGINREAKAFETCILDTPKNYQRTLEDILRLLHAVKQR